MGLGETDVQTAMLRSTAFGNALMALLMLAAAALALTGCVSSHHYLRYRMTIEIETPQGLRTGSGVLEVRLRARPFPAPGSSHQTDLRGEAIPIDLAGGRTIYAVLDGPGNRNSAHHLPREAFGARIPEMAGPIEARTSAEEQFEFLRSRRPSADLRPDEWPMLAEFRNQADPRSVETVRVDSNGGIGPGLRVRRIRIEITEDEVTEGIERRLPWLGSHRGSLAYNERLHPDNRAKDLTPQAFRQWF